MPLKTYFNFFPEYEGEFFDGLPHGQGTWFGADGSILKGQFRMGHSEGPGILVKSHLKIIYILSSVLGNLEGLVDYIEGKGIFLSPRGNQKGHFIVELNITPPIFVTCPNCYEKYCSLPKWSQSNLQITISILSQILSLNVLKVIGK